MRERIIEILSDTIPGVDFETETDLIEDGIVGSLDLVSVVTQLISEFDVEISVDDLVPENFCNADAITALVESKR